MHRSPVPHRRALAAAAVVIGLSATAACGSTAGSHTSSPPAGASQTAQTSVFKTSLFDVAIPSGWTDTTNDEDAVKAVNVSGSLRMLLMAPTAGAAVIGEHIDVTTVAQPVPDDQLAAYLQSVSQNGATAVSTPQPFQLNGATGLSVTYTLTVTATPPGHGAVLKVQDMIVNHVLTYEIVLNTAQADFDKQAKALQQMLASWQWH